MTGKESYLEEKWRDAASKKIEQNYLFEGYEIRNYGNFVREGWKYIILTSHEMEHTGKFKTRIYAK